MEDPAPDRAAVGAVPSHRFAVRLGLRLVKGLPNADAARLVAARGERPFAGVEELWRRSGVPVASLAKLAAAGAFRPGVQLARREALWAVRALGDEPLPLFAASQTGDADEDGGPMTSTTYAPEINEPPVSLRPMTAGREAVEDYGHVGLTLRSHPLAFLREDLRRWRILSCAEATARRDRSPVRLAGIVLVCQKPGSAKGVLFITVEDETGVANLVIWPQLFEASRRVVLGARLLGVEGQVQREGEVVHVVARRLHDLSDLLDSLARRHAAGLGSEPANKAGYSDRLRAHAATPSAPSGSDSILDVPPGAIRLRPRDFR